MPSSLATLLRDTPFALFGVHPSRWDGPAFVGDVVTVEGVVRTVQLVYQDAIDGTTMGAQVSCVDAGGGPDPNPMWAHLAAFVARYEPRAVRRRMRRRKPQFLPEEFVASNAVLPVGGGTGATMMRHISLPLQVVRLAVRSKGTTDIGVCGWRIDARDFASSLVPVDGAFASEFDRWQGFTHGTPP